MRGLLLVEAMLSAVVIAVGLVFISRGLSGQLTAIRAVEERARLLSLVRRILLQLEGERAAGREPSIAQTGAFEAPDQAYRWTLSATPQQEIDGVECAQVGVAVEREDRPTAAVRLSAIWPADWVSAAWR